MAGYGHREAIYGNTTSAKVHLLHEGLSFGNDGSCRQANVPANRLLTCLGVTEAIPDARPRPSVPLPAT